MAPQHWRLLDYSSVEPAMNLAIEEAILRCRLEHSSPETLRLWQNPPTVVIGCFQKPELEVETAACKKFGVNILRRVSGGGAVYHDFGNLNYSIIIKKASLSSQTEDIEKSYDVFCSGIIEGLKTLGVEAYSQKGNIMIDEKKISGSAQHRLYDAILHHGTLMVNVNLNVLGNALGISEPKRLLLNLCDLFPEISLCKAKEIVIKGFEKAFAVKFRKGTLTSMEKRTAKALYEIKYSKSDWNSRKRSVTLRTRYFFKHSTDLSDNQNSKVYNTSNYTLR